MMEHDVLILGGGLTGCLTAIRLAQSGLRCVLLERGRLLAGASLHNAGGLYFQLQPDAAAFGIEQREGLRRLSTLIRLARPAWDRLEERLPGPSGIHWTGGIIVALDDAELESLREKNRLEAGFGIDTRILSSREARSELPSVSPRVTGGSHCSAEGYCETDVLVRSVERWLVQSGVRVIANATQIELSSDDVGYSARWLGPESSGVVRGLDCVSCLGAFTGAALEALGLPNPIEPLPLQIHRARAPIGLVPLFVRAAGSRLSLKQLRTGEVVIGGGWPAEADPSAHDRLGFSMESLRGNHRLATRLIPGLGDVPVECWRRGWAAWTRDGLPIIAQSRSSPRLHVACGGNGFTLAPLYAELLCQLVQGSRPAVDLSPFALERFGDDPRKPRVPPDG